MDGKQLFFTSIILVIAAVLTFTQLYTGTPIYFIISIIACSFLSTFFIFVLPSLIHMKCMHFSGENVAL